MSAVNPQMRGLSTAAAAPWVALAGAKGGVGKTTLAVNLAILLARSGYRTLLADLDPGCGDVGVHLRLAGRFDLEDALGGTCAPHDAVVDGPAGIKVVLGTSGSTVLAAGGLAGGADPAAALALVEDLARSCDVVVCDTGAGIGPMTLAVAERCELVLGVTTCDAPSLTDTYALCKVLHLRGRPLPRLVVNRVRSRDEAMRTAGRLGAVTKKFLGNDTKLCGWVEHDPRIEQSINDQRPLALSVGPAADDLRSLCAAVLAVLPPLQRRREAPDRERTVRLRPAAR